MANKTSSSPPKEKQQHRLRSLHVRVSDSELEAIRKKADAAGVPVSELIRKHLGRIKIRSRAAERERLLLLRRIGVNLNQLARWANTHKQASEAVQVISLLMDLERAIRIHAYAAWEDEK